MMMANNDAFGRSHQCNWNNVVQILKDTKLNRRYAMMKRHKLNVHFRHFLK